MSLSSSRGRRRGWIVVALALVALTGCQLGALDVRQGRGDVKPPEQEEPPVVVPVMPEEPVIMPPRGPMAGETPMRLLTRYEYDNTVRDVFGVVSAESQDFPSENLTNGFENNAWVHSVNPMLLRRYMEASERLAPRILSAMEQRGELEGCAAESCGFQVIERVLPKAFRRPVTQEERDILRGVYDKGVKEEGWRMGVEYALQALLQSPQFLYRLELEEPTMGEMVGAEDKFELVGPYEMASRLSYFLWASAPDDLLLEAAAAGELATEEQVRAQVERMLEDPRARQMSAQFFRQWLNLDKLSSVIKDTSAYPGYTRDVNADWVISVQAFYEHAFWDEGTFDAFMRSPAVFYTPTLARLYNVQVPEGSGGVFRVDEVGRRSGLLSQPALMAVLANTYQSSPILRGVFVRERMLCQPIPSAPNNIAIEPPDPDPRATTRERFRQHTEDPLCADCHALIDPLGFGFENYDGVGAWREEENGLPVDATGKIALSRDPAIEGDFNGVLGLSERLAQSERVRGCMAEQWFQFAMGRSHDASDAASISQIKEAFAEAGSWRALLTSIALSDSFRYRKVQGQQEVSP